MNEFYLASLDKAVSHLSVERRVRAVVYATILGLTPDELACRISAGPGEAGR